MAISICRCILSLPGLILFAAAAATVARTCNAATSTRRQVAAFATRWGVDTSSQAWGQTSFRPFHLQPIRSASSLDEEKEVALVVNGSDASSEQVVDDVVPGRRSGVRAAVRNLAKSIVTRRVTAVGAPSNVSRIRREATTTVSEGQNDSMRTPKTSLDWNRSLQKIEDSAAMAAQATAALDAIALAKTSTADAFDAADSAILNAEKSVGDARMALQLAKKEAANGISAAERAALDALSSAQRATELVTRGITTEALEAEEQSERSLDLAPEDRVDEADAANLSYDEVNYQASEMAPPFIGEDQCLVPGEPVVRVEKAPDNSRRIFAGVDIVASVDDVWNALTDYEHLQKVVPNLVVNEVLQRYESDNEFPSNAIDQSLPDEVQCEKLSKHMTGAKLRQVGGAKVVGINFSARTTLEVREWPEGMPDFAHFYDEEMYLGKDRRGRAKESKGMKLERYKFPRPFALTKLKHRDISMQSVVDDDGEFRLYQGVWRMQPLPGCSPEGGDQAMRLTYAVEISPRPYLPVALVEGRITQDLCANLMAIREYVSSS